MEADDGNEQRRKLLSQAGLTNESLARAVNRIGAENGELLRTNKSTVTHWLQGKQPHQRTVAYLCEALARRLSP